MLQRWTRTAAFCAITLAACGQSLEWSTQGGSPEPTLAAETARPASPQPSFQAVASGSARLRAYVGHYPFEDVQGVSWNTDPAVIAAVRRTVADPSVRKAIAETRGPATPVELIDGKLSAWACQAHNCGDHQWLVMVDPVSGAADVCYHRESATPGRSRWFLAGGQIEIRDGDCTVR